MSETVVKQRQVEGLEGDLININSDISNKVNRFGDTFTGRIEVVDIKFPNGSILNSAEPSAVNPTTASNVGAGTGVFKQKNVNDLQFKTLVAGSNISLSDTADTVVITATLPPTTGEANTASNVGSGTGVFKQKAAVNLEFKSLTAGNAIQLTNNTNDVNIKSNGAFVTPLEHGADNTGVADSTAAFNTAAGVSGFVLVPAGTFKLNSQTANSATWMLLPGAIITGQANLLSGAINTSRLKGRVVHYENSSGYRGARFGTSSKWLEQSYWSYADGIAELSGVSAFSGIGVAGVSRTSDEPAQTFGSIGIAGFSVNDSLSPEPAWGSYINHQRVANAGPSYGMEIDNVNRGNTFDLKPYSTNAGNSATGHVVGLWLTCGGGGDGLLGVGNATSAAIALAPNPTAHRRGIVFTNGCVDTGLHEVITSYNGGRMAWYDFQGSVERLAGYIQSSGPVAGVDLVARNTDNVTFSAVSVNGQGNKTFAPKSDNQLSCGAAGSRWSVLYAATGTINTSDERAKKEIAPISECVLDAWEEVDFQQYRFKEDDGKIHFGVVAQRVVEAFERHGLNALDYGIIDKSGELYGVRYEQALCLEMACMRRTIKQLKGIA